MTILTVGRRGQSERGESLSPMNLHESARKGERERESKQSAVKAQREGRGGEEPAHAETQEKKQKQRRTRIKQTVGEKVRGRGMMR